VVSANSRVNRLQERVRRGRKMKSKPATVIPKSEAAPAPEEDLRGALEDSGAVEEWSEDWSLTAAGEMVKLVVAGPAPVGVTEDGVKRQTAPEGRPPVQAKVMVEWKPPVGVAVKVTGLDALPWTALVEAVEGERANPPAAATMVKVAWAEVFA
jgi:hypothetical protein